MKNFQPGGLRGRKTDLGGRPQSDVNSYAPKFRDSNDRSDSRPRFTDRNDRTSRFETRSGTGPKKDVQLFTTNCTTCGKSCEVPFRPDGTKPVLCRDCFTTKNTSPTNMTPSRDRFTQNEYAGRRPERTYELRTAPVSTISTSTADIARLVKQLAVLETKVSQILESISLSEKVIAALPRSVANVVLSNVAVPAEATEAKEAKATTKIRKPKKVTPAIKKAAAKKKVSTAKKIAKKVAKK